MTTPYSLNDEVGRAVFYCLVPLLIVCLVGLAVATFDLVKDCIDVWRRNRK